MEFELGGGLTVTCVRCGASRELPEGGGRMPAQSSDPADGVTVRADTACMCGADRVRIKVGFDSE